MPGCGSFEVRLPARTPQFFYFDDLPSRRLRLEILTRDEALEQAKALARAEREKGEAAAHAVGPPVRRETGRRPRADRDSPAKEECRLRFNDWARAKFLS